MMNKLKILNKKQVKEILRLIDSQWEARPKLSHVFLENDEGKLFIINKEFSGIDEKKLRINSMGLYFGEMKNNELRLTIEGSQLVGKYAKKRIIELDKEQIKDYIKGKDIGYDSGEKGFFLIRHNGDFFGTAKLKNNKILNFFPKSRRVSIFQ